MQPEPPTLWVPFGSGFREVEFVMTATGGIWWQFTDGEPSGTDRQLGLIEERLAAEIEVRRKAWTERLGERKARIARSRLRLVGGDAA